MAGGDDEIGGSNPPTPIYTMTEKNVKIGNSNFPFSIRVMGNFFIKIFFYKDKKIVIKNKP